MTITADQVTDARRLFDLADEAETEARHWKNNTIRLELQRIRIQLEHAARIALTRTDAFAEAWAEAAVLTLNRFRASRRILTAIKHNPTHDLPRSLDCLDGVHAGCLACGCRCHR